MTETLSYWDKQFRFSAILPDFQDRMAGMVAASVGIEETLSLHQHSYGSDDRQWVELSDGQEGPLIPVFIHGGYWRALRAEDHRFILPSLCSIGPRVGNIEHRLIPAVRMADLISDVTEGLDRLAALTDQGSKFVIIGHSAGAHLGLAAIMNGAAPGRVAGFVGISGIYDLMPIPFSFLQVELGLTKDEAAAASFHTAKPPVPSLLVVGEHETDEFQRQAELLSSHADAPVLRIGNTHHMNILTALADADGPHLKAVQDWLETGQLSTPISGVSP